MNKCALIVAFILLSCTTQSQEIHELEPVSSHYKLLQTLDMNPNNSRAELDDISFPTDGRNPGKQFVGLEPSYLTKAQVELLKNSVRHPANSSEQTRAELDYLLFLEEKRTESIESRVMEIARIGYWPPLEKNSKEMGRNVEHLFWEYNQVTGQEAAISDYPRTLKLLSGVTRDMRIMEFTVKYKLLRARPYQVEPKLNAMEEMGSPSFASGHTLWAYIQAFVWSELLPEKREAFLEIAFEVGHSREIMGIHYPSDEEAARVLAHAMLTHMNENPDFRNDLDAAKAEWK